MAGATLASLLLLSYLYGSIEGVMDIHANGHVLPVTDEMNIHVHSGEQLDLLCISTEAQQSVTWLELDKCTDEDCGYRTQEVIKANELSLHEVSIADNNRVFACRGYLPDSDLEEERTIKLTVSRSDDEAWATARETRVIVLLITFLLFLLPFLGFLIILVIVLRYRDYFRERSAKLYHKYTEIVASKTEKAKLKPNYANISRGPYKPCTMDIAQV